MKQLVIYIHGKGGSIEEAEHYKPFFANTDVIGFDYQSQTPWEAKKEFPVYYDMHSKGYDSVILIANSIGAFFALSALGNKRIDQAFFISPIVDMEELIQNMMTWAKVSENELSERKEICTDFGETLSWEYLCYVILPLCKGACNKENGCRSRRNGSRCGCEHSLYIISCDAGSGRSNRLWYCGQICF